MNGEPDNLGTTHLSDGDPGNRARSDKENRSTEGKGVGVSDAPGGDVAAVEPETEADVWRGRTSWKHYISRVILWLAANIIFAMAVIWSSSHFEWLTFSRGFAIVTAAFALSGLEMVIRRVWLKVIDHRYRLTTQRLFIERGIFSRTIDQTELIRVDDVRLYKSFMDRLVGLGSVAIISTDATDREIVIEGITDPDEVAESIRTRMRIMRRKSLFLEQL